MIKWTYIPNPDTYSDVVLEVGVSGDLVFLAVGKLEENFETRTFTQVEGSTVAVPAADLVNAVKAAVLSQHRDDLVAAEGTDAHLRPVSL